MQLLLTRPAAPGCRSPPLLAPVTRSPLPMRCAAKATPPRCATSRRTLLHIQVGPFATRDEARSTLSRLAADGYPAFIRQ